MSSLVWQSDMGLLRGNRLIEISALSGIVQRGNYEKL